MNTINLKKFEKSPVLSEIKVSYKCRLKDLVRVTNSHDAFNVLYNLFDKDTIELKEEFFMLLLNRANYVLGWVKLSSGGTSSTVVDIKIIFIFALQTNAHSIILCHNHPSKNITPSDQDISFTNKVIAAGKLLDLKLHDHLIISADGTYYTFADEGLI